jgi:hypothetical protein
MTPDRGPGQNSDGSMPSKMTSTARPVCSRIMSAFQLDPQSSASNLPRWLSKLAIFALSKMQRPMFRLPKIRLGRSGCEIGSITVPSKSTRGPGVFATTLAKLLETAIALLTALRRNGSTSQIASLSIGYAIKGAMSARVAHWKNRFRPRMPQPDLLLSSQPSHTAFVGILDAPKASEACSVPAPLSGEPAYGLPVVRRPPG